MLIVHVLLNSTTVVMRFNIAYSGNSLFLFLGGQSGGSPGPGLQGGRGLHQEEPPESSVPVGGRRGSDQPR